MTSRNEVQIDIEVEGGARAERQFNRAEKGARGLGRSTRGLINPLLGAGLVAGILGGGLLGLALSSGSASNSIYRIQGALEGLVGTVFRKVEPGIDAAARLFEKLPIAGQLAVLGLGIILGIGLVAVIGSAAGAVGAAVTGFVATAFSGPLIAGITGAIASTFAAITGVVGPLLAAIFSAVGLAVAAVVVGLASLALIAWDQIFNDGALLRRFEDWLGGVGWIAAIAKWDSEVLTPLFTEAWQKAIGILREHFIGPLFKAWYATRDLFGESFGAFFTESIPATFRGAWDGAIGIFRQHFVGPLFAAWFATRDLFRTDFVAFFTETIPGAFMGAWDGVIGLFRQHFVGPLFAIWFATRDFFQGGFTKFFAETIPAIFFVAWTGITDLFRGFANGIIGILNSLIRSVGRLPIPRVSVGVAYRSIGPLRIPYPTFSVSTRPLSSYVGTPQIATIPDSVGRQQAPTGLGSLDDAGQGRGGNTTNNNYFLTPDEFNRRVQALVNAPNAQAAAVGLP